MNERILIADDERLVRWSLRKKFEEWGYCVAEAQTAAEARERWLEWLPELIVLDVRLPDGSGVDLLTQMKPSLEHTPVIMITADPQLEDVKTALRAGAYDFLTKPFQFEQLRVTLHNALEAYQLRQELETLRQEVERQSGPLEVIAESPAMKQLMEFVRKVANSAASTLLIQGESGTGKDLIAKTIHQVSARRNKAFVAVNCSAIPETLLEAELFGHERGAFTDAKTLKKGLLEIADHGSLFLDEIGEMPLVLQAKLLRVLEDQTFRRVGGLRDILVDIRVIAASNRDLEQAVKEGRFREDLYYRLTIIPIFIPPLRERTEDILPLAEFFLRRYGRRSQKSPQTMSSEAQEVLVSYDWPGNVRELKNAIERAVILEDGPSIQAYYLPVASEPKPLPEHFRPMASGWAPPSRNATWELLPSGRYLPVLDIPEPGTSLEDIERGLVQTALQQTRGNQTRAARLLNISRDALRYRMKKFSLGDDHSEFSETSTAKSAVPPFPPSH
ncbi:MAG: sigma-54-dependent Fis family transcriptional regulator [Acidobacteria bacterium]|nr:sigma-54-dependent Fis family transcriptional regulator [Acidobacteriota bacterium]